jgi:hypothetical protein
VGLLIVQRQRLAGVVMAVGSMLRPVPVAVGDKERGALQPEQARLP